MKDKVLYKIISCEQWQESQLKNEIELSSMDKKFIHLATESQLSHVAKKFWSNKDYLVLRLDVTKLIGQLVYENNPGGITKYYHLYKGNIPLKAVINVRECKRPPCGNL